MAEDAMVPIVERTLEVSKPIEGARQSWEIFINFDVEINMMKILRIFLIVLTAFLALTGMLGGIGLIANLNAPPVEQLQGSIFKSFFIPGLALFLLVGGGGLFATILLIRRSKFALLAAATAGIIILFFEFVEVLIIGSPAGVARTLQIFYFGLGTLIEIVTMLAWFFQLRGESGT